jgi:hypothetical protein
MLKLNKFAQAAIRSTGKPFTIKSTGKTIKARLAGDPNNFTSDKIATLEDFSGELLQDQGGTFYLVDRLSVDFSGLWRGAVWTCQQSMDLYRLPLSVADAFGRSTAPEATLVKSGIHIHFMHAALGISQTPIMPAIASHKTALVRSLEGIGIQDVIVTTDGTKLNVMNTERFSYGLSRLTLEQIA